MSLSSVQIESVVDWFEQYLNNHKLSRPVDREVADEFWDKYASSGQGYYDFIHLLIERDFIVH